MTPHDNAKNLFRYVLRSRTPAKNVNLHNDAVSLVRLDGIKVWVFFSETAARMNFYDRNGDRAYFYDTSDLDVVRLTKAMTTGNLNQFREVSS